MNGINLFRASLIGVTDDGKSVGVRDANRLKSEVQNVARSIEPPLVLCAAFRGKADRWPNLTVKKIPHAVLKRCEWRHDDYSLTVENVPQAVANSTPLDTGSRLRAAASIPGVVMEGEGASSDARPIGEGVNGGGSRTSPGQRSLFSDEGAE